MKRWEKGASVLSDAIECPATISLNSIYIMCTNGHCIPQWTHPSIHLLDDERSEGEIMTVPGRSVSNGQIAGKMCVPSLITKSNIRIGHNK